MTQHVHSPARGTRATQPSIWVLVGCAAIVGCADTVDDGVYACAAPGRGTDCPAGWYCRTDVAHPSDLRCHEGAGPPPLPGGLGAVCDRAQECESASCSNGRCAPPGFAWIEPGDFFMGSPIYQPHRNGDEESHAVAITRSFAIGVTEVTQTEWSNVFPTTAPSYFAQCGGDCPVERVNLFEAMEYANARSAAEGLTACYSLEGCDGEIGSGCPEDTTNLGHSCAETDVDEELYRCTNVALVGLDCDGYRVPTEAEWEYAARAGGTSSYPQVELPAEATSDCDEDLLRIGWYRCNAGDRTHPVAQREPNLWGLRDTVGNVFEMVWDQYASYESLTAAAVDPLGSTGLIGATNGVHRGGAYDNARAECRSAYRGHGGTQGRSSVLGFRLARTMVTQGDGS